MLGIAIRIASTAFENKKDKGGNAYILHCLYVMHKVKHLGELAMICAVLHDILEDCKGDGYTANYLRTEGISDEAITLIEVMTKSKDEQYFDYIKRVSLYPIAKQIKLADLEHNSKITRLKGLNKTDFSRLEKYAMAYEYLK